MEGEAKEAANSQKIQALAGHWENLALNTRYLREQLNNFKQGKDMT